MAKKLKSAILPTLGALIGSAVLPGVGTALGASISSAGGAAIGSGIGSYAGNHDIKSALLSAGGSYLGGQLGNKFAPASSSGTVGSNVFNALPDGPISNFAQNTLLPASIANMGAGQVAGSYLGSQVGEGYGASMQEPAGPTPFSPSRQDQKDTPNSISGLGTLSPEQESTNLATQGVYGGGQGGQENDYFLNLINRRLVDDSGNVGSMDTLKPIEMSYLQKLGLGGYGNSNSLLEAISQYHA